jgi:hypothetical protein
MMRYWLDCLTLWLNGMCVKHLRQKDYPVALDPMYPDFVCYQCHQERQNRHTIAWQSALVRIQQRRKPLP